jgi:uncharacterized protein (DUF58 family)
MTVAPDARYAVGEAELQKLGVLVPLRFQPLRVRPGRHALGRAGDGMRLLRSRPYVAGEDNPRDIDKFSPLTRPEVIEWEHEARATIGLLCDTSASTASALIAPLRDLCALQLTYSLGRAGDRVVLSLFDDAIRQRVEAANLAGQMRMSAERLDSAEPRRATDIDAVIRDYARINARSMPQLTFILSDFCGIDADALPRWLKTAMPTCYRTVVPVVLSYSMPETLRGAMKVSDAESSGRRLIRLSKSRIRAINAGERERAASIVQACRCAGIDAFPVTRQRDVFPALVEFSKRRRGRR